MRLAANKIPRPNEARRFENPEPSRWSVEFLEAWSEEGAAGDNQTNQHTATTWPGRIPTTGGDAANCTARMRLVFKITERARQKAKPARAYLSGSRGFKVV